MNVSELLFLHGYRLLIIEQGKKNLSHECFCTSTLELDVKRVVHIYKSIGLFQIMIVTFSGYSAGENNCADHWFV
jgi:hypothetical protein